MTIASSIGGVTPLASSSMNRRLSMVVWGPAGCGKTVLATTMPGKRFWLSFDPDGTASFDPSSDDIIMDLSAYEPRSMDRWDEGGLMERELATYLKNDPSISSIIVDSMTSYGNLALAYAVMSGKANGKGFTATLEIPGLSGYGIRNRNVLSFVRMLLRVTAASNIHVMFICHEASPKLDKDTGSIQSITLLLGGDLPNQVPLMISEVWHMSDDGKRRHLAIRPYAKMAPMRSRMFETETDSNIFQFKYNAGTKTGEGIAHWFEAWKAGGFKKLALPK